MVEIAHSSVYPLGRSTPSTEYAWALVLGANCRENTRLKPLHRFISSVRCWRNDHRMASKLCNEYGKPHDTTWSIRKRVRHGRSSSSDITHGISQNRQRNSQSPAVGNDSNHRIASNLRSISSSSKFYSSYWRRCMWLSCWASAYQRIESPPHSRVLEAILKSGKDAKNTARDLRGQVKMPKTKTQTRSSPPGEDAKD